MALIQLNEKQANKYNAWLNAYERQTGKLPGATQRLQAFNCARSNDPWKHPEWAN